MYGIEGLLAGRTLLDRYLVEEVVGRGGMGAVYRARDLRLDRYVALKVVALAAPDPAAHARLRARFGREARAAAALHHPNVVGVHDFGTDPALGIDFLVMELLRGEDLATRLVRKGPPALRTALDILHQAARGVAAGHRAGLVHRDVKPGNLFLEPGDRVGDVQVKVLDFGIVEIQGADERTMTRLTQFGRPPFSPAYASPEQMRGETRLLPATDVFSLGAVGFHLLTGRRAFTSADPLRAAEEMAEGLATLPTRLPQPVRSLLRRALAARPEARHPDAGALADALEQVLAEREAPAPAPRPAREKGTDPAAAARPRPEEPAPGARAPGSPHPPPAHPGHAPAAALAARPQPDPPHLLRRRGDLATPVAARAAAPQPRPPERRPGALRRAVGAVWHFCVTTAVVGLFAGAWVFVADALAAGNRSGIYLGIGASTALAPLAVHRILGRRGSYGFALIGCLGVTLGVHEFLAPNWEAPALLATLCGLQLLCSVLAERITGRLVVRGA